MAWEVRGTRRYYYRKVRLGGRVRSIYVGTEEAAGAVVRRKEEQRERDKLLRDEFEPRRAAIAACMAAVAAANQAIEDLLWASMLSRGYHKNKDHEWRKRRETRI